MKQTQQFPRSGVEQDQPGPVRPMRTWQRAVVLALVAALVCPAVGARGPGRAGIADLAEEPDAIPPPGPKKATNFVIAIEPTQPLPGNPSFDGLMFDALGRQFVSVSVDAVRGGPDGMTLGQPEVARSGDLMVTLGGVAPVSTGKPAINAHIGLIDLSRPLKALKTVGIPPVYGLERYVSNKAAMVALGKALFWDAKVGSDGQACASCHFSAGADNRLKNQLNPGQRGVVSDNLFNPTATGGGGPNYTLKAKDFPFYQLKDPKDRNSAIVFQSNDVVSSQGTFAGPFQSQSGANEKCGNRPIDEFSVHGTLTRRVAPRNTPSVINAVFNFRNFWDGRANNIFNGNNPFGSRDPSATVLQTQADGTAAPVAMALPNASLASQAVGPALSDFEMSCANKTFQQLGRKMLPLKALSTQRVHPEDAVLGPYRDPQGVGTIATYQQMIQAAFNADWWNATGTYGGYSQMENNFSMFWGLAIMAYEATLVSDDTPFDRFVGWAGTPPDPKALSKQELSGLAVFRGPKALCNSCHRGAEFTVAASTLQPNTGEINLLEQMFVNGGQIALYDTGFYNTGVRPSSDDIGLGGLDPFGNPLSYSRQWLGHLRGKPSPDLFLVSPCLFLVKADASDCSTPPSASMSRVGVDGAFKTPGLRNVSLTAPYFHNGSRNTLEQVVEFYDRGGDRRGPDGNDSSGLSGAVAPDGGNSNVHPAVRPLGLTKQEKDDLVAFLRTALTDQRVACSQAPFDHPELVVFNGHVGNEKSVTAVKNDVKAVDEVIDLAEVGAKGLLKGKCLARDDGKQFDDGR